MFLGTKCVFNNLTHLEIAVSPMYVTYHQIHNSLQALSGALTESQISKINAIPEDFHQGRFNDLCQCLQEEDKSLDISDDKKCILDICLLLSKYMSETCMVPLLRRLSSCTGLKHLNFETTSTQNLQQLNQVLARLKRLEILSLISANDSFEAPFFVTLSTVDDAHWFTHNPNLCSLSLAGNEIPTAIYNSFRHVPNLKNLTCLDTNKVIRDTLYSIFSELLHLEGLTIDFVPFLYLPNFSHLKTLHINNTIIDYPEFQTFIDAWLVHTTYFRVIIENAKVDCKTKALIYKLCGENNPISMLFHENDNDRHVIDYVVINKPPAMLLPFDTSIDQHDLDVLHSQCQIRQKQFS